MADYKITIKVETGVVGHAFLVLQAPGQADVTVGYYPVAKAPWAPGIIKNDALSGIDRDGNPAEHASDCSRSFTTSTASTITQKASANPASGRNYGQGISLNWDDQSYQKKVGWDVDNGVVQVGENLTQNSDASKTVADCAYSTGAIPLNRQVKRVAANDLTWEVAA